MNSNKVIGFFSGLLVDIFFGTYLGFFALIYMYLGYIVGKFHEVFFSQNIAIPIDRKSTRLNSSHLSTSRMPSSA